MNISNFEISYDRFVGVLYIKLIYSIPITGIELTRNVIWRYSKDNDLVGLTILDFVEVGSEDLYFLIEQFCERFDLNIDKVLEYIKNIT